MGNEVIGSLLDDVVIEPAGDRRRYFLMRPRRFQVKQFSVNEFVAIVIATLSEEIFKT